MIIETEGGVQAQVQAQEISIMKESAPVANPSFSFYGSAEDQMREVMKSYYGKGFILVPKKAKMNIENLFPFELLEQWLRYGNGND